MMPTKRLRALNIKIGFRRSAGFEKTNKTIVIGTNMEERIAPIKSMFNEGSMTAMKLRPGGGVGRAPNCRLDIVRMGFFG